MNSSYKGMEFFARIILVTAMMIQYLSMPLSAIAASMETDDTSLPPRTARQAVEQMLQQEGESNEAYLERIAAEQPDLVQNAAMIAVQEALNGSLTENDSIEEVVIDQINRSIEEVLLTDPNLGMQTGMNSDGSFDDSGAYSWGTHTFDPNGDVTGAWALQANLGDDVDQAAFEEAFEARMETRSEAPVEQATAAEPVEADAAPVIDGNPAAPQPFDPFEEPLTVPQATEPTENDPVGPQPLQSEPTDDPPAPLDLGALEPVEPYQPVAGDPPTPVMVNTQPLTATLAEGELPPGLPPAVPVPDNIDELLAAAEAETQQVESELETAVDADADAQADDFPLDIPTTDDVPENWRPEDGGRAAAANCNIYVDHAATGAGNGSSWANAYTNLQTGLNAADSCKGSGIAHVRVAQGTYEPEFFAGGSFFVKDRVQVHGGYNASNNTRNWKTYPTILQGNGSPTVYMDGQANAFSNASKPITRDTWLDGLHIRGLTDAIRCDLNVTHQTTPYYRFAPATSCSPTIRYSIIENSNVGIRVESGNHNTLYAGDHVLEPQIRDTIIRNNNTGMRLVGATTKVDIHRTTFHDNGTANGSGGAIWLGDGSGTDLLVYTSTFINNTGYLGGAIHSSAGDVKIYRSSFINNTASLRGGAVYQQDGSGPVVYSSLFAGNSAVSEGGALYQSSGTPKLNYVTFVNNRAGGAGGAILLSSHNNALIENSIFKWNQSDGRGHHVYSDGRSTQSIKSSLIATDNASLYLNPDGTGCGHIYNLQPCPIITEDVFDADPLFIDPDGADNVYGTADDNYRLRPGSPAIDRARPNGITYDQDNNPRPVDDSKFTNTNGHFGDLGAYELQVGSCTQPNAILFDPSSNNQSQNGHTWATALNDWSDMTRLASLCNKGVWMKGGVYTPGSSPSDKFTVPTNVRISGGFLGTDSNTAARDLTNFPTVLSGDIDNNDVNKDGNGVTTDHSNIRGTNSSRVVYMTGSNNALYSGIIVTGGDGGTTTDGAGIYCDGCRGFLDAHIIGNRARHGAGLLIIGSGDTASPTIRNSTISNNKASGTGGGVYMYGSSNGTSSPTFTNVDFLDNEANQGGGIRITAASSGTANPTFTGGSFVGNQATNGQAGAIYLYITTSGQAAPTFTDINIADNSATTYGGALAVYVNTVNASNTASASPTFEQVQMVGNSAPRGGAVYHNAYGAHPDNSDSDLTFVNSTIGNNTATLYGGGLYNNTGGDGSVVFKNSIIADNTAGTGTGGGQQIVNVSNGIVQFNYSLLPSNTRGDVQNDDSGSISYGTGTLFGDPLFVDADGGNLRLRTGSLAIDSGNNVYAEGTGLTADLGGAGRFYNDPGVANRGQGDDIVDMGVFEHRANSCASLSGNVYVRVGGAGNRSGTSWGNATDNLNHAIGLAYACSLDVRVAGGVYTPGPTTGHSFRLLPNVKVYGGYVGSGSNADSRTYNPPTVLSGDIDNNDVSKTNGITTDHANIRGNNSRQIVIIGDVGTSSYVSSDTVLDGLVVTGADALAEERDGGGIVCVASSGNTCSPTLSNLQVVGNRARYGGGLLVGGSGGTASPTIENTTFSNNKASGSGGGVYMYGSSNGTSSPTFTNVDFLDNEANQGGGVRISAYSSATANPTFTGGSFVGNRALDGQAGAIYLYITSSGKANPTFTDINIADNSATTFGGALAVYVNTVNASNTASASPTFEQVLMVGNSAPRGGAVYHNAYGAHPDNSDSDLTFVNSTIANNTATLYGGGLYNTTGGNGRVVFNNTIIANNVAQGATAGHQILTVSDGIVELNHSFVPSNSTTDVQTQSGSTVTYGTGVVLGDPLFTDAANGDWRLLQGSPAIDTGNNSYLNDRMTQDRDGNPRTMGAVVDMGAYEFTPWVTIPSQPDAVTDLALSASGAGLYATKESGSYFSNFTLANEIWGNISGLGATAHTIYVHSDNTLYVGGDMTAGVARWTGSAWVAVGSGLPSGTVYDIVEDDSGTLYAGGAFGVYKLDGGVWQAVGNLSNVRALAFYDGALYAGGSFGDGGGSAPDFLARWDGSAWQAVLDERDSSGVPAAVNALAVYAGQLAIGTNYNINVGSILFWDGALLTETMGVKSTVANSARVLDFDVDGSQLAIVGDFDKTVVNGVETPAFDLAVWTGTQFIAGVGGLYEANNDLDTVLQVGGDLYVGGDFEKVGGRNTPNVGLLDMDTTDLSVDLAVPAQALWPGTADITLTINNLGGAAVGSATAGLWLPPNVSLSSSSGTCAAAGQLVNCTLANVQPNTPQAINITLSVADNLQDPANIRAFASTTRTFDSAAANNVDAELIDLTVSPDRLIDLGIDITTDVEQVNFQETVTYTVNISNTGTGAARDALATITLPSGGVFDDAFSGSSIGCTSTANKVFCDVDRIEPNAEVSFELYVQMNGNGIVQATAEIADQSTETADDNEDNNTATSPEVLVFAAGRATRQVGNVVIAANSFEVEGGKVEARGGVELGVLDENDQPVYTIKLDAGLDVIEWLESVEGGAAPPAGQPALSGRGVAVVIESGIPLFIGDFQIEDADDPTLAPANDVEVELDQLEDFNIKGQLTYTGISLEDGTAEIEAEIEITPPGIDASAEVVGQLLSNGSFTGQIAALNLTLSALEVEAENLNIVDGAITAGTITITLSDDLGGASGTATDLRITTNSITIGGVGATIPLPDIDMGETIKLTGLKATVGYFRGVYSLKVEGTLELNLPDNEQEIELEFSIDSEGNIAGEVSGFTLNLAGASLELKQIAFDNSGMTIATATLTLPESLNGASGTLKGVRIDETGLTFSGGSVTVPLPDIRVGGQATIYALKATLEIENNGGDLSFAFAIAGKVRIMVPNNEQVVSFSGRFADGVFSGSIDQISITMMSSTLVLDDMQFENGVFSVAQAQLTLPAALQGTIITVTDVTISSSGIEIGGGSVEVPLPDIGIGGQSATVQLSLTNASVVIEKAGEGFNLTVKGTVSINISGNGASATGSLTIDWQGRLTGQIDSFSISIVGMEFRMEQVKLKNGVVSASVASITLPEAFGGLTAEVYDLRVGNGEFSIGGGKFALPEIRVGSFILSVEGQLIKDGNAYIIKAAGSFKLENMQTAGPGCSGISVSLTIRVNTNREMVIEVAPNETSSPELDQLRAGVSGIELQNVTVVAHCRIPIAKTGFSITQLFGSLTLQADTVRIELGVTIETDFQLLGAPALRSSPTLGVESGPGYFQLDFNAAVEVFAMFEQARMDALLRVGQKNPGEPSSYLSATLWVDVLVIKGNAHVTAWTQDGRFHLVGGGHLFVGVREGQIARKCITVNYLVGSKTFCAGLPPTDYYRQVKVAFGEFYHGGGTTWGVKAEVEFSVDLKVKTFYFHYGVYVNTAGDIRFGSVRQYRTITPPDITRAMQLQQGMERGDLSRAMLSDADQKLLNDYRTEGNTTYVDFTVGDADVLVNFTRVLEDGLELRLIRPDGLEIALDNLPNNMGSVDIELQPEDESEAGEDDPTVVQTAIVMEDAMQGDWQVKLIGGLEAEQEYFLDIIGSAGAPELSDLTIEQVDDTHADVTWAVSSDVPTTTVNIYATTGPITTTEVITNESGIAETVVIDVHTGAVILEDAPTNLNGTPQTARIDFSSWASGEYYIWVDANDNANLPTRDYALGTIIVEHPWQETWTANTVITPSYRTLDVSWDTHANTDVDSYHVYLTPDGENFLSDDTRIVEVGDSDFTRITGLRANTAYAVKVVAVDLDTERKSDSEVSNVTVAGAPFTVTANPETVTLSSGDSTTVQLTLTADEDPFPTVVVLSEESAAIDLMATVQTEIVTPTVAGATSDVTILASPLAASGDYTVTLRASAAGDVRFIDIPVTIQSPTFELQGSVDTITLTENATATVEIDATYLYGEDDEIFVAIETLPRGVDATFDKREFAVGENVTLTITDTNLLTNGTSTLTVVGNDDDGNEKMLDIDIVVDKPTFRLVSVEGTEAQATHNSTVRYTVRLEGDGWESPVNVGVDSSSLSGHITPTIQLPARALLTVPTTFDVVIEVGDAENVSASVYEMIVTGTSDGVTEELPLQLAVGAENTQPDMQVQVSLSASEVNAGDLLTVTTRYENRGTAAAITDLDSGYSHTRAVTASEPLLIPVSITGCDDLIAGTDTNGFDGDYRCDAFGTLQPGDVFTLETVYRVHEGAADGATVTLSEILNTPDEFDTDDNKWSKLVTVRNTSDVTVMLAASDATQNAGESVTYTATVKTNGNADATGARVTFTPDTLMDIGSMSDVCSVEGDVVVCTVGAMASGCARATASDAFTCDANSATTQVVSLTVGIDAAATADQTMSVAVVGTLTDANSGNNSDSETTTVTTQSALNPQLTAVVEESAEGGTHSHTLVVTNEGPSVARNVTVSYTLPTDASYTGLTVNGNRADKNNPQIVSGLTLAPSESLEIKLDIKHLQDTAGLFVDSVIEVSADGEATQDVTLRRKVTNVAPTIALVNPTLRVLEGGRIQMTAIATDTNPLDEASPNWSVDWDLDDDGDFDDKNGNVAVFDATNLDGVAAAERRAAANPQVSVRVTDGTDSSQVSREVTVVNVAPTVDAGDDQRKAVIDTFTLNATFADPASADTHTAIVKWGDGTEEAVTVSDNAISATHSYTAIGEYEAEVCVEDDDGGEGCDVVQLQASCLEHGLVTRGMTYHFDNRTLIATTNLNYIGSLMPNPLPESVDLTLYHDETAIDTISVEGAFAENFSQAVSFEWDMAPLDAYTLTVKIDDDGTGNAPLALCVSGAPEMDTNTGIAPQDAPDVGESKVYGPTGVTIGRTGGDDPGMITVTRTETDHADADYVDLMWSIEADDEEGLDLDLEVCYTDGDLSADQQANEANLILYHRHEPTDAWEALVSIVDTDANCVSADIMQFSDFMIGLAEPNAITLESFTATATEDGTVMLDWVTSAEFDHAGFNVYRTESAELSNRTALNAQIIPSGGIQGQGGNYFFEDATVENGTWYYWLEDVDIFGKRTLHGPIQLDVTTPTAVMLRAANTATHAVAMLVSVQTILIGVTLLIVRRRRYGRRA